MKIGITIFCVALSTLVAFGQSRTIKGRLVSAEDRTPMPGYNVMEPGTSNGTVTDVNGEFTLTLNIHPAIVLFPGCFSSLYVEYEDGVDFKEVVFETDTRKYKDSKRVEKKFLRSRPTRYVEGEVIDRKTKQPVYNCEVRVKGGDGVEYTDQVGSFTLAVPNNKTIEVVIKKGTSIQMVTYSVTENSKRIKLRL